MVEVIQQMPANSSLPANSQMVAHSALYFSRLVNNLMPHPYSESLFIEQPTIGAVGGAWLGTAVRDGGDLRRGRNAATRYRGRGGAGTASAGGPGAAQSRHVRRGKDESAPHFRKEIACVGAPKADDGSAVNLAEERTTSRTLYRTNILHHAGNRFILKRLVLQYGGQT
jgi:hypothetical protein